MRTSGGDITAAADIDDVAVTIGVGDVGTGTGASDVTAVSDVDEMAVITGVCNVGTGDER